jgi:hypothetical protein
VKPELKIKQVIEIYNHYQIKERTAEEMEKFFATAIGIMKKVKAEVHKKSLLEQYAEWLYKRDY